MTEHVAAKLPGAPVTELTGDTFDDARREIEEEERERREEVPETWPCNDCGLPCLKGDDLCGPCYEKQRRDEEKNNRPQTLADVGMCEADFR